MKFEQMQYARPDFDAARETFASLRARIAAAPDAQAQLEAPPYLHHVHPG